MSIPADSSLTSHHSAHDPNELDQTRTALITGCSRGLGLAMTEHLLAQGYRVFGCARGESPTEHERYTHFRVDVTDEHAVTQLFRQLRTETKTLTALINNAGIASMNAFALTPSETARRILNVNVEGTMLFCQKALGLLKRAKHPRIVNFTTVAVPLNLAGEAVYAASKSAVETLTRILAKEYGSFSITCNAIGPSPIDTALIRNVPSAKIEALLQQQAVQQKATSADVINLLDFYLRPESDMISGQIVYLGGIFS
ncbi:MAG: SDR family NAD(P)-dependent oxidoreductase [Gammaproteobacteria bacterium]